MAAIRTALNFFLGLEIKEETEMVRADKAAAAAATAATPATGAPPGTTAKPP